MKFSYLSKPKTKLFFQPQSISKLFLAFLLLAFFGCSATKRFSTEKNIGYDHSNSIKVLLVESSDELAVKVDSRLYLSDESGIIAEVNGGNALKVKTNSHGLSLSISEKEFQSNYFFLDPSDENQIISIDGKNYRGRIKIFIYNSQIKLINQVGLEDYVKGVMTKEMPIGEGNENYEALKAFSICVRTYAYNNIKEHKDFFDIYPDTRDQVYGGVDGETELTNKIVDETIGQLLFYDGEPAVMFYHSTCGGYTEDVKNVFTQEDIPYLKSIEDGSKPYCKISPRYEWIEYYTEEVLVNRLYKAALIDDKAYELSDVKIKSRFESVRVNELEIAFINSHGEEKSIILVGNEMRSVIRTGDGRSILRSNFFNIEIDKDKNLTIIGKGSGHGVGLCQWGAIGQSKIGINYNEILNHYFPGTIVKSIYD